MLTNPHNHFKISTFNKAWILLLLHLFFSTTSFLFLNETQEYQNVNTSNNPNFLINQRENGEWKRLKKIITILIITWKLAK